MCLDFAAKLVKILPAMTALVDATAGIILFTTPETQEMWTV